MEVERIYNKNGSYSKNCPNCGAAIESEKCPYCGTTFIDFACLDADKPFFMKVKYRGKIYISNVMIRTVTVERSPLMVYGDNNPILSYQNTTLSMDFDVLRFEGEEKY